MSTGRKVALDLRITPLSAAEVAVGQTSRRRREKAEATRRDHPGSAVEAKLMQWLLDQICKVVNDEEHFSDVSGSAVGVFQGTPEPID